MNAYKQNAILIGTLFIITMLLGMIDAYVVALGLKPPITNIPNFDKLLLGSFSVLAMAIGIVFIAIAFFPVVKKHSESIALTYVVFRTIECVLLVVGSLCYLYIIVLSGESTNIIDSNWYVTAVTTAIKIKFYGYQLAMIVLGLGSIFLCYSLFKTKAIPRLLSIWGVIGYISLLLSAVLSICEVIDTTKGLGMILYIPGGLWELIALPLWLFTKGFHISLDQTD